ncbi:hypothetical protein LENED_010872 [Lentinula edodes]|uniref:Uncharacterized protein n=1 Tax=Lentinula edodes TaxID=5353 RepID=A0A1Q3ENJ9_LENED|nr:hypothetical protein LENED_010872 [Lentinula edodes]
MRNHANWGNPSWIISFALAGCLLRKFQGQTPRTSSQSSRPSFDKDNEKVKSEIEQAHASWVTTKQAHEAGGGFTHCAHIVPDISYFSPGDDNEKEHRSLEVLYLYLFLPFPYESILPYDDFIKNCKITKADGINCSHTRVYRYGRSFISSGQHYRGWQLLEGGNSRILSSDSLNVPKCAILWE